MALARQGAMDVIHPSDQGCQCTSITFGNRCREAGAKPSMGAVGDGYDNAIAESVFAILECELVKCHSFRSPTEARLAVFDFIKGSYKPRRLSSVIRNVSPMCFETIRKKRPRSARRCASFQCDAGTAGSAQGIQLPALSHTIPSCRLSTETVATHLPGGCSRQR